MSTNIHDALLADRARALAIHPVSRETLERLDAYVELLLKWQPIKNLVGPSTLPVIWSRHILDSLQILDLVPDAMIWVDLGSGAGFPGLVIACVLTSRPETCVHLVESNGRKAAFLREVIRTLNLSAQVHNCRIEDVASALPENIDCVTARALAPLVDLLEMQAEISKKPCKSIYLKGQDIDEELTQAAKYWSMEYQIFPSVTDPDGHVLLVQKIIRRSAPV